MANAVVFAVVDHTQDKSELMYLDEALPVTPELLELAKPLQPTEIFRFGAPCETSRCSHWSGADCKLVERITTLIPVASLVMPSCRLRPDCRWYAERGRNACIRCPHVVTQDAHPSEEMRLAAEPR